MSEISTNVETAEFQMPDSVVRVQVERGTNPLRLPSKYTPESQIVTELFKRGHEPTERSDQFDQIDPVTNLTAKYDEEVNQINIQWSHNDDQDVDYVVNYSVEGGTSNKSQTSDLSFTISSVERGATYVIEVTAVSSDNADQKSESKRIELRIPDEVIEEPEPEDPEPEEPEQPEQPVPPVESEEPEEPVEPEVPQPPVDEDDENDNEEENSSETDAAN